jgi:hypothetical protein
MLLMNKYFHERIKATMEEGNETIENKNFEGEAQPAFRVGAETLPSTEFVKVEKNLASLGFFTPSSKRLRNAQEKSFTVTTVADGQRLELKGTIIPSAKYGLPITADQDKWIALCKILTDIIRKDGQVTNPVSFTSADILRLLHKHRHSGKNYREIEEWLDVLFSTTIFSEGVVYLAKEKRRVKDRFRVFERAVSFGKELSDGKVADKNYVWFSDWQLQNINSNHLLPIDLEAYRELKNHIAKALVPLLQVWLYATRNEGVFEKRYDELTEFLNIRRYQYHSLIVQTLGPSLDELKQFGYLADWQIERTSDGENYKVVFYHGDKFHRDRRARLNRKQISVDSPKDRADNRLDNPPAFHSANRQHSPQTNQSATAPVLQSTFDPVLVSEFTRRGIDEKKANQLLANLKPGQDVVAQLEQAEQMIQHAGFEIRNPAGFTIRLIERNIPVPDGFETSAKRKAREEREQREREQRAAQEAQQELEGEYESYRDAEVDRYIEANTAAFDALKDAKWKADRERYSFTTETMAKLAARFEIQKQLPLLTFEEFLIRKQQGINFPLKPVGVSPDAGPASVAPPHEEVVMTDDPVVAPDAGQASVEGGEETSELPEPATTPAMPEAGMELLPESAEPEPDGDAVSPGLL